MKSLVVAHMLAAPAAGQELQVTGQTARMAAPTGPENWQPPLNGCSFDPSNEANWAQLVVADKVPSFPLKMVATDAGEASAQPAGTT
jgi:hypothetical protein